jgi:hypothetical protein
LHQDDRSKLERNSEPSRPLLTALQDKIETTPRRITIAKEELATGDSPPQTLFHDASLTASLLVVRNDYRSYKLTADMMQVLRAFRFFAIGFVGGNN